MLALWKSFHREASRCLSWFMQPGWSPPPLSTSRSRAVAGSHEQEKEAARAHPAQRHPPSAYPVISFLTLASLQDKYRRQNFPRLSAEKTELQRGSCLPCVSGVGSVFFHRHPMSLSRSHITFPFLSHSCPKRMHSGCKIAHLLGKSCIWLFNNNNKPYLNVKIDARTFADFAFFFPIVDWLCFSSLLFTKCRF